MLPKDFLLQASSEAFLLICLKNYLISSFYPLQSLPVSNNFIIFAPTILTYQKKMAYYTDNEIQLMKNNFITLLRSTNRPNIEKLIQYLETCTDFFTAPASRYDHNDFKGGLLAHSLNTYKAAVNLTAMSRALANKDFPQTALTDDSVIICSLLHDICNVNINKEAYKFFKDDMNNWRKYLSYEDCNNFPLGHGEKSVFIIMSFITLTPQEACAIRWHMGSTISASYLSTSDRHDMKLAMNTSLLVSVIMYANSFAKTVMERVYDQKITNEVPRDLIV